MSISTSGTPRTLPAPAELIAALSVAGSPWMAATTRFTRGAADAGAEELAGEDPADVQPVVTRSATMMPANRNPTVDPPIVSGVPRGRLAQVRGRTSECAATGPT